LAGIFDRIWQSRYYPTFFIGRPGRVGTARRSAGATEGGMAGRQESAGRRSGKFDAFDLALRRASVVGAADAASLPRVADRLAADGGAAEVSWRIVGAADVLGRPALEISLDGVVPLVCQRCLQSFSWPIAQCTTVLLAHDERELAALDDEDPEHEVVLADGPLAATALIEDELLLTLPFAPHCERAACVGSPSFADVAAERPATAFAALAGLKKENATKPKD
jgi:uncharacterized protein